MSVGSLGVMMLVPVLGFGFLVLLLVAMVGVALRIGKRGRADRQHRTLEARLIQEVHLGLERLEKRVETLETLIIDRQGESWS